MSSLTTTTTTTTTATTNSATATNQQIHVLKSYVETFRILNANPVHFITLSILFLPIIISSAVASLFLTSTTTSAVTITTTLLITLSTITSTVTATALITYSTSQTLNNTPLTFKSTFNSLRHSFLPLLSTFLAAALQLLTISLFTFFPILIKTPPFLEILTNTLYVLLTTIIIPYFITAWSSSASISLFETKSGFRSLSQSSANMSITYRIGSFIPLFLIGHIIASVIFSCEAVRDSKSETKWHLYIHGCSLILELSLMFSYYVVLNTVMYFKSKTAAASESSAKIVIGESDKASGYGFTISFYILMLIGPVCIFIGFFLNGSFIVRF